MHQKSIWNFYSFHAENTSAHQHLKIGSDGFSKKYRLEQINRSDIDNLFLIYENQVDIMPPNEALDV